MTTEAPPRRLALSPSRASDFKQCPLKYRLRAVDRVPEAPTKAAFRGTVVHAALESLYSMPAAERVRPRALELVEPAWRRLIDESPELADLIDANDVATFLDEARTLVTSYYDLEDPTRFNPAACELFVEHELTDGALLRGYIDRLDIAPTGQVRVVDYKTGRAPSELFEGKALFQMKFYALVVFRTRGTVPTQLELLYLADGKRLVYRPDEPELLRFERTLSAIWKAILKSGETGDFRPNRGKLCGWCDFKAHCPEFGGTVPVYPGWPEQPSDDGAERD
ncbi:MAG: RecB family exonuclease [Nocardiaceae bacterium]|nr:RecB family exonuclease [Nocardiaceae bacterium]